jgi:hypothetical protein
LIVTAEDHGTQTVARTLSASGVKAEAFEADPARGCATRLIPGT